MQADQEQVSSKQAGVKKRDHEFAGVERPTGMVEWTTGVEHWTGLLECHAHKLAHAHKMLRCIVRTIMNQLRP